MNVKLRDGESVSGWIEYFDDTMIRLTREGLPNLFIYKHQIRTISERGRRGRTALERTCALKDFPTQLDLGFAAGAADIALEAGELLRGYFERGVATEYKGDVDLVTEADRASEKLIVSRLNEQFPDHGILAKREPAPASSAPTVGMLTRSTARPISPTAFRSSMFRWASSIAHRDWRRIRMGKLWRAWSTIRFTTNSSPRKRRGEPGC